MSREVAEFIIYIVNEVANNKGKTTSQVYNIMEETGCIKNYLTQYYDVLHTMSSQSIVEDIVEYVESRGSRI